MLSERRGLALAVGVVALLALHALLVWPAHGYLLSDATGYLADARWLAGKAGATAQGPTSFYNPGWAVLAAPLYLLFGAPRSVQLGALALNGLLAAAVLPVAYAVGRRAFDLPRPVALGGAALAATYPAVVLLAGYEWGESLYQLLFLAFVLAAAATLSRPGVLPAVSVGVVAAACNATHPRGLGMVPVAVVFLGVLGLKGRLPRRAAAAGIAAVIVLFVATRLLNHALLDAIYSKTSAGVEGDVLGRLTDPHLLWGAAKAAVGQLWYLTVATFGLAPIGALWLLTTRRVPTALRAVTLAAAGATLAASALEMSDGTRVDHMVYGRYIEGVVPVLLVAGAAGIVAWRSYLPRLLVGVALLAAGLAGLLVLLRGGDLFRGDVMPLNVTGLLGFRSGSGPDVVRIDVARTTLLSLAALTVVVAVARWRAVGALALVAALFTASAVTAQARTLRPFDDRWSAFTEIPEVVHAVGAAGPVAYDRAAYDAPASNFYQVELADRGVRFFDSRRARPPEQLVIGGPDRRPGDGARLAFVELGVYADQALWVMPGALQDRLARTGFLLPEDPTAALPDPVQRIRVHVPERLGAGTSRTVRVTVTHLGAGAAWRPLETRPRTVQGSVRLGAHWLDATGAEVLQQTAELPQVLLPGDGVGVDLALVAPAGPGRYRLEIGLRQEGLARFPRPARFTVEVR